MFGEKLLKLLESLEILLIGLKLQNHLALFHDGLQHLHLLFRLFDFPEHFVLAFPLEKLLHFFLELDQLLVALEETLHGELQVQVLLEMLLEPLPEQVQVVGDVLSKGFLLLGFVAELLLDLPHRLDELRLFLLQVHLAGHLPGHRPRRLVGGDGFLGLLQLLFVVGNVDVDYVFLRLLRLFDGDFATVDSGLRERSSQLLVLVGVVERVSLLFLVSLHFGQLSFHCSPTVFLSGELGLEILD